MLLSLFALLKITLACDVWNRAVVHKDRILNDDFQSGGAKIEEIILPLTAQDRIEVTKSHFDCKY